MYIESKIIFHSLKIDSFKPFSVIKNPAHLTLPQLSKSQAFKIIETIIDNNIVVLPISKNIRKY